MLIGIDPGPKEHGVVWYDGERATRAINMNTAEVCEVLLDHSFNKWVFACEMIECFGMPVGREVFETVLQIGQMQAACFHLRLIPRRDIKMHLCGSARAKDANIRQALIDKIGPVGTRKNPGPCYGVSGHLWAALGVAVTAFDLVQTKNEWYAKAV
jgi:hypothetical protein